MNIADDVRGGIDLGMPDEKLMDEVSDAVLLRSPIPQFDRGNLQYVLGKICSVLKEYPQFLDSLGEMEEDLQTRFPNDKKAAELIHSRLWGERD